MIFPVLPLNQVVDTLDDDGVVLSSRFRVEPPKSRMMESRTLKVSWAGEYVVDRGDELAKPSSTPQGRFGENLINLMSYESSI
jgi:hypothetical protein